MMLCRIFFFFRSNPMTNMFERLTDENLAQNMENVLDIVCKIGKGYGLSCALICLQSRLSSISSYGCVYKAKYRETGQFLAIKQG
jgi:hypothetical protein